MSDLISRQEALKRITAIDISIIPYAKAREYVRELKSYVIKIIEDIPSAEPERNRKFLEIVTEYPKICTYPECEGKPYYAIKYEENGETIVGFGTYKPEVLSQYLQEYFISSAEPERKKGKWIEVHGYATPGGERPQACPLIEVTDETVRQNILLR